MKKYRRMRNGIICVLIFLTFCNVLAQSESQPQALNSTVSDFGTSFIFSPAPICKGCVEVEIGTSLVGSDRFLPVVLTIAPLQSSDFTILLNAIESTIHDGERVGHFSERLDFVWREKVWDKDGLTLSIAPRGTIFLREVNGGRLGESLAGQYSRGQNAEVLNLTTTRAINSSNDNPSWDNTLSFDYYRTLGAKGASLFAGVQYEKVTGSALITGVEEGFILPFQNGQVELATELLDLFGERTFQFQVRAIFVLRAKR